jgi:hypothetical protein
MTSRRDHLLPAIPVEIRKCLSDAFQASILTKKVLDEGGLLEEEWKELNAFEERFGLVPNVA